MFAFYNVESELKVAVVVDLKSSLLYGAVEGMLSITEMLLGGIIDPITYVASKLLSLMNVITGERSWSDLQYDVLITTARSRACHEAFSL